MITAQTLTKILQQPDYSVTSSFTALPDVNRPAVWRGERDFQRAVVDECDRRAVLEPEYGLIFAIPNGQYRKGQRMEPGLRGGVCDLCVPLLRVSKTKIYGACYIELKVGKNTLSTSQKSWIDRLRLAGNFVEVVWDDLGKVMSLLEWYLRLGG